MAPAFFPAFFKVASLGSGFLAVMAKPVAAWREDEICGLSAAGVKVPDTEEQARWVIARQRQIISGL